MEKSSKNQWEHLTVYTDTNYVLLLSIIYYLLVIAKTEELKNDMKFIGQMANVSFTTTIGDDVSKSLKLISNYNFGFQSRTTTKERNLPATICHYLITRHCRNLSTFINLTLKCFSTVRRLYEIYSTFVPNWWPWVQKILLVFFFIKCHYK